MIPTERIVTMIVADNYDLAFQMIRENLETEGPAACLELWQRLRLIMGTTSICSKLANQISADALNTSKDAAVFTFVGLPFNIWTDQVVSPEDSMIVVAAIGGCLIADFQHNMGATLLALRRDILTDDNKWQNLKPIIAQKSAAIKDPANIYKQTEQWIYAYSQPPG